MAIFGKEKLKDAEVDTQFPLLVLAQLQLDFVAKNVLSSILTDLSAVSRKKAIEIFTENPEKVASLVKHLVELVPSDIPDEYLEDIAEATLVGRQVVVLGPHWSVADAALFIKLIAKLQQHPKCKASGMDPTLLGPASSKFFDFKRADIMFASTIVEPMLELGIELFQVAQVNDRTISDKEKDNINRKSWKQILKGMKQKKILGIFPEGTRAKGPGTGRVPVEVGDALLRVLRDDALIVSGANLGSHRFLGVGMPWPNVAQLFSQKITVAKPITKLELTEMYASIPEGVLGIDQDELHPIEVANSLVLLKANQKYWGQLSGLIQYLNNSNTHETN